MSRILFATIGSLGDLHPLIAVAGEMSRRGHSIAFCTSEYYRKNIESLGFEFYPLRPDIAPDSPEKLKWRKDIMEAGKGAELLLRKFLFPQLRETYDDLLRAVRGGGIDLLVTGEIVYAVPLVAEITGVPWASCILSPMSFFSVYDPPILSDAPKISGFLRRQGPGVNRFVLRLIKLVTWAWSKPVRELRKELNLRTRKDPIYEGKHSPQLVLALFSASFAKPQPDWPPNTIVPGFAFYDRASEPSREEFAKFIGSGDPPIVFTLGSAAVFNAGEFYERSARAASLLKRRAILLVGENKFDKPFLKEIAVFDYLPYSKVFSHAAAAVHQGGIGTTAHAARAGVPMLIMPFSFDQHDNAARIVRMGAGRSIARAAYSAERAAKELASLLDDPAYGRRAKEFSHALQKECGSETAANALESLLKISFRKPI